MHQSYTKIHSLPNEVDEEDIPDQSDDANPKPCDYFDLIAGTGTGGLIAIMLGRLRMSLVDCMNVYVKMTRKVFETDKTIAGIPYRSTLFKASKLEDAIRECVREYENEKKQSVADGRSESPMSPVRPGSTYSEISGVPRRSMSFASTRTGYSSNITSSSALGSSNAYLYDSRANRTKT